MKVHYRHQQRYGSLAAAALLTAGFTAIPLPTHSDSSHSLISILLTSGASLSANADFAYAITQEFNTVTNLVNAHNVITPSLLTGALTDHIENTGWVATAPVIVNNVSNNGNALVLPSGEHAPEEISHDAPSISHELIQLNTTDLPPGQIVDTLTFDKPDGQKTSTVIFGSPNEITTVTESATQLTSFTLYPSHETETFTFKEPNGEETTKILTAPYAIAHNRNESEGGQYREQGSIETVVSFASPVTTETINIPYTSEGTFTYLATFDQPEGHETIETIIGNPGNAYTIEAQGNPDAQVINFEGPTRIKVSGPTKVDVEGPTKVDVEGPAKAAPLKGIPVIPTGGFEPHGSDSIPGIIQELHDKGIDLTPTEVEIIEDFIHGHVSTGVALLLDPLNFFPILFQVIDWFGHELIEGIEDMFDSGSTTADASSSIGSPIAGDTIPHDLFSFDDQLTNDDHDMSMLQFSNEDHSAFAVNDINFLDRGFTTNLDEVMPHIDGILSHSDVSSQLDSGNTSDVSLDHISDFDHVSNFIPDSDFNFDM